MRPLLYFALFLAVFGTACTQKYYAPNKLNIPNLPEVGESRLAVGTYTGDEFGGTNLQGSYRMSNHLVATANFFTAKSGKNYNVSEDSKGFGSGFLGEFGIGPYWSLGENAAVSVLTGTGYGKSKHTFSPTRKVELRFHRPYVQPAFSFRRKFFTCGLGLRLSYLNYINGDVDAGINRDDLNVLLAIDHDGPFLLPEMGLNVGFVGKYLTVEYSLTNLLYQKNYDYRFADRTLGVDIVVNPALVIGALKNRKKKK